MLESLRYLSEFLKSFCMAYTLRLRTNRHLEKKKTRIPKTKEGNIETDNLQTGYLTWGQSEKEGQKPVTERRISRNKENFNQIHDILKLIIW